MSKDVTFCGVFDGHGPHGHLVARKVRDSLPVKLLSLLNSIKSKQNGPIGTRASKSDSLEAEKEESTEEDKLNFLWEEAFLKSFNAMDKELRSHPNLECFCSGCTAVTIIKQVILTTKDHFIFFGFNIGFPRDFHCVPSIGFDVH
jgi:serine/threonine protein phosphatase PrpC